MFQKQKQNTFYCFSPLVMILTFIIEIGLFVYVLFRYKASRVQRIALLTLLTLAAFQLAEYNVCTTGYAGEVWSRLGFAAITALPPLGIHLAYALAKKPANRIVGLAYVTGVLWATTFLLSPAVFSGHQCTGNYVVFQLQQGLSNIYPLYYYGWLLVGIALASRLASGSRSKKVKKALRWQIIGYGAFIVPTTFVNIVNPSTTAGIPSIMCGFAVIFAVILGLRVMAGQKHAKYARWRDVFSN